MASERITLPDLVKIVRQVHGQLNYFENYNVFFSENAESEMAKVMETFYACEAKLQDPESIEYYKTSLKHLTAIREEILAYLSQFK